MLWEAGAWRGCRHEDWPGRLLESILKFAYFWYNFMPLARGTAAAGYIFILSMFLAAGMPVTASIPEASLSLWSDAEWQSCPHLTLLTISKGLLVPVHEAPFSGKSLPVSAAGCCLSFASVQVPERRPPLKHDPVSHAELITLVM